MSAIIFNGGCGFFMNIYCTFERLHYLCKWINKLKNKNMRADVAHLEFPSYMHVGFRRDIKDYLKPKYANLCEPSMIIQVNLIEEVVKEIDRYPLLRISHFDSLIREFFKHGNYRLVYHKIYCDTSRECQYTLMVISETNFLKIAEFRYFDRKMRFKVERLDYVCEL